MAKALWRTTICREAKLKGEFYISKIRFSEIIVHVFLCFFVLGFLFYDPKHKESFNLISDIPGAMWNNPIGYGIGILIFLFTIYLLLRALFKKVRFNDTFIYYHEFNKPEKKVSWNEIRGYHLEESSLHHVLETDNSGKLILEDGLDGLDTFFQIFNEKRIANLYVIDAYPKEYLTNTTIAPPPLPTTQIYSSLPPPTPNYQPHPVTSRISASKGTSSFAVASFITGIVGLLFAIPFAILSIIFGRIALSTIKKNPELEGRYLAIGGIILGIVGILFTVFVIILLMLPLILKLH